MIDLRNSPEGYRPQPEWPEPIDEIASNFAGQSAHVYRIPGSQSSTLRLSFPIKAPARAYCFSVFVRLVNGVERNIVLTMSDELLTNSSYKTLASEWSQPHVAVIFPDAPTRLNITVCITALSHAALEFSDIAIIWPQLEEGSCPTSPISPGETRAADVLYQQGHIRELHDSTSGHMLLFYKPQWQPHFMDPDSQPTVFFATDEDGSNQFRVYHEPSKDGRLRLELIHNGRSKTILSGMNVPTEHFFAVSLMWNSQDTRLFVDGIECLRTHNKLRAKQMTTLYYGNQAGTNSINGIVRRYMAFSETIRGIDLKKLLYSLEPDRYDYLIAEIEGFQEIQEAPFNELFRILLKWSLSAPNLPLSLESEFRQHLASILETQGFIGVEETETSAGKTDIAARVRHDTILGEEENFVRIELKRWRIGDYRDVPTKPLKYMRNDERFGVYLMIDKEGNAKEKQLLEFMKNNQYYQCQNIDVRPFGEMFPFHARGRYWIERQECAKDILVILARPVQNVVVRKDTTGSV